MIKLPIDIVPAITDWTAYPWLVMGDPGIGKSGLLASIPDYLLVDPELGLQGYPGLKVQLNDWADHLALRDQLVRSKGAGFKGLALDSLNVSYDHASKHVTDELRIKHPSDLAHGTGWTRVTTEFINWLRSMKMLGLPIIATCHTSIVEVNVRNVKYNKWVPAFVGGSPGSTFAHIQKIFDIVGFMTLEEVIAPPTKKTISKSGGVTTTVDIRTDTTDLLMKETRVIHFAPSTYWTAQDTSGQLPDKVFLTDDWRQDWPLIQAAWGTGDRAHRLAEEPVHTEGLEVPSK
jgi:hypothetical protein